MAATPAPRVLSLLSASTEIVCRLGMAHALVGRSHGCDAPPAVLALPAVTAPRMDPTAPSEEIDAAVRAVVAGGGPVYEIRNRMVAALAPDVILTQDQCRICAVTRADVAGACADLPASTIVTIEPTTLGDVLGDVATIAAALGVPERGARLVASMERRLDAVRAATAPFPRAAACHLEWLAPVMGSGYWIHELFDAANCAMVHGAKGGHCPTLADDAALNDAQVLVLAPCGFSVERTRHELRSLGLLERWKNVRAVREGRCYVADGDRFYNRSSCEIVETAEMTAEMAFPELRGLWGHHGKHFVALDELDAFCDLPPRAPAGMPAAGGGITRAPAAPPPEDAAAAAAARAVAEAQLEALRAEDFDAAFALCSPKNRERLSSPAKFREICGGASFAALLTGGEVSRTDVVSASAATVAVAAGDKRFLFDLAFEGGAWRTDGVRVVQSSRLFQELRALSEHHGVPIYCFAEDLCASGAYFVACAGDELWVDASSLVGSVGVVATPGLGFGLHRVLENLGVERRRFVSGDRKAELLDPFSPADPAAVERLVALQAEIHEAFKAVVRSRRGEALARAGTTEDVWATGEVFAGEHAVRIGLADGVGGLHATMRDKFGPAIAFLAYERRPPGWPEWLSGGGLVDGLALSGAAPAALAAIAARLLGPVHAQYGGPEFESFFTPGWPSRK